MYVAIMKSHSCNKEEIRKMNDVQAGRMCSQSAAHALIKRVINARREQDGFLKPITVQQWSEESVAKAVAASIHLVENCCEAEREELAQDPYPDDNALELGLQAISYALNGLMAFTEPLLQRQDISPSTIQAEKVEPLTVMAGQQVQCAAASEYLHWLLEADEIVQRYRAHFPQGLTEQEMVEFLSSPLAQVLSFSDFEQLALSPFATQGEVLSISQRETPRVSVTKAQQEIARTRHEPVATLVSKFLVEVKKPDGTTIRRTIERRGRVKTMGYLSWAIEAGPDALAGAGGFRDGDFYCFHTAGLGDRDYYPAFPVFSFSGYPGSICSETFGLMTYLLENDFYPDQSAALRFLLMGVRSSLFKLAGGIADSIFVPAWGGTMGTKSVLYVPNWVLPEELADYWRQVRPAGARERRLPSAVSMQMFRFVLKNTSPGTEPQWSSLVRQWQQETNKAMTRDKLYKTYHSVINALFPCHPNKEQIQATQARMQALTKD